MSSLGRIQKASAEWNQKRLETLDFINRSVKQKDDARHTFDDVDKALDFYNQAHPDGEIVLPYRPVLEDFLTNLLQNIIITFL